MPTFGQAWHIELSYRSLIQQSMTDWELIVVVDGDIDGTQSVVDRWTDPRVRILRNPRNMGLGYSLNLATREARADILCYLPSDDKFFPHHIEALLTVLDDDGVFLAYSGVQSHHATRGWRSFTLAGNAAVGHEYAALRGAGRDSGAPYLPSGNILALVQVAHRKRPDLMRWPERSEYVTDALEADMWRHLLQERYVFRSTLSVTCEWTDHPDQHHKIISDARGYQPALPMMRAGRGISGYREYYRVQHDEALDWRPSDGYVVNQSVQFPWPEGRLNPPSEADLKHKILLVGSLGYNPERLDDLTSRGHEIAAVWSPFPEEWDYAASLPFQDIPSLPRLTSDVDLRAAIRDIAPNGIYGLLNYQALGVIERVVGLNLDIPLIFHFKESQFLAMRTGQWARLCRILERADATVFINEQNLRWFERYTSVDSAKGTVRIVDGDLPASRWLSNLSSSKLSVLDGEPHTVCSGRPLGLQYLPYLLDSGIHVHFYGTWHHKYASDFITQNKESRFLHLHDTVAPSDWCQELSQYDAAWTHVASDDELFARSDEPVWSELNYPARLGTYALAGLPWIVQKTRERESAVRTAAETLGVDVSFDTVAALVHKLQDLDTLAEAAHNMASNRRNFTFASQVPILEALMSQW